MLLALKPSDNLNPRIDDINIWIKSNMLKLNKDYTDFILFSSRQHVKKTENLPFNVISILPCL